MEDLKYLNFLRYDTPGDLSEICNEKDKNSFIYKYNITTIHQLIGKCIQLYDKDGIKNFQIKLIHHFYDIAEKNAIFYYITEKIGILFKNFYDNDDNTFRKEKITISNNLLAEFLKNDNYENLQEIPYISTKYEKILIKNNIKNTFDLIGKYLELESSPNNMYIFLKNIGIYNNIDNIICCIGEKSNIIFPGTYNIV